MREVGFDFNSVIIVLGLLFSGIYSIILGCYIWIRSHRGSVVNWYLTGQALISIWTIFHIFELMAPTLSHRWVIVCIVYLPVCFFAPAYYMFTVSYGNMKNPNTRSRLLAVFIPPGLLYLSLLTNPMHKLFYTEFYLGGEIYGPLVYLLLISSLVYMTMGVYEFLRNNNHPSIYRHQQMFYFSLSVFIPGAVHGLAVFKIWDPGFNAMLLVMPLSLTLTTIAVLKYQFLDILPMTLAEVVETIDDGFLVVNTNMNIEDYNALFFRKMVDIEHCKTFDQFLDAMSDVINNKAILENLRYSLNVKKENYVSGEIEVQKNGMAQTIQYTTKAITDIHGVKIATIITFHDITEIQKLYIEYGRKKSELIIAKNRLEEHIAAVQMLTVETERNRLMTEVHDTLGHSMTELLALLEKCDLLLAKEPVDIETAYTVIDDTLVKARDSLAQIRRSVSRFRKTLEES